MSATSSTTIPFPYIGAGDASYFETAEMYVVFADEPTAAIRAQVEALCPSPFSNREWEGRILCVSGDDYINAAIASEYESSTGMNPDNRDHWEHNRFFASDEQLSAFDQAIVEWLMTCHALCPLQLALRNEDCEAGTEFAQWHYISCEHIRALLPHFVTTADRYDSTAAYLYYSLLDNAHAQKIELTTDELAAIGKVDQRWLKTVVEALLQEGKTFTFSEAMTPALIDYFKDVVDEENPQHLRHVLQLCEQVVAHDDYAAVDYFFLLACIAHDMQAASLLGKSHYAITLVENACQDGDHEIAIALFEQLDIPSLNVYTLSNLLYCLQEDNSGCAVNAEVNRRFLAHILPFAEQDPTIHFNAACLHVEMGEFDQAVENIQLALERGYDKEEIKEQLLQEQLFKELVAATAVLTLFEEGSA